MPVQYVMPGLQPDQLVVQVALSVLFIPLFLNAGIMLHSCMAYSPFTTSV